VLIQQSVRDEGNGVVLPCCRRRRRPPRRRVLPRRRCLRYVRLSTLPAVYAHDRALPAARGRV
jgi:hypothetical protein